MKETLSGDFGLENSVSQETEYNHPATVFISYAGPDHDIAVALDRVLSESGCVTIRYERDFPKDADFVEKICDSLLKADFTISLVSESYVSSNWCVKEFLVSHEADKLVPVLLHDCDASNLPEVTNFIDLRGRDEQDAIESLVSELPAFSEALSPVSLEVEKVHEFVEKSTIILPTFKGGYSAERWQRHAHPFIETLLAGENVEVKSLTEVVSSREEAEIFLKKHNADLVLYGSFQADCINYGFVSSRGWSFTSRNSPILLPEQLIFRSRYETFDDLIPVLKLAYGNLAVARNRSKEAAKIIREAVGTGISVDRARSIGTGLESILIYSGENLFRKKHWDDVIDISGQVLRLNSENSRALNLRALGLIGLSRLDEAVLDLESAISIDPQFAEARCNLGYCLIEMCNFEDALVAFDKSLLISSELSASMIGRANANYQLGNTAQAVADCDRALSIDPFRAAAFFIRGLCKQKTGSYSGAIDDYLRCLELDYEEDYVFKTYRNMGSCNYFLGNYEQSINDNSEALLVNPTAHEVYYNRGGCYYQIGNYEQSIFDNTEAIRLCPDFLNAYYNRGCSYRATGRWGEALSDFQKYCDHGGTNPTSALINEMNQRLNGDPN